MTDPKPLEAIEQRLRKAATCVYLATEESVADQLSGLLREAATTIEHSRQQTAEAEREKPRVDARDYRRRTGIEVDNHHNALTCPYCNPEQLVLIAPRRLRDYEERAETAEARVRALEQEVTINNGNTFVFCDFVRDRMGCVRGAGHNGPHALSLPPHPQGPVLLFSATDGSTDDRNRR